MPALAQEHLKKESVQKIELIEIKEFKVKNGSIFLGDCLKAMQQLPEDSVTLAFTSPPYLNAINYEEHVEKLQETIGKKRFRDDLNPV